MEAWEIAQIVGNFKYVIQNDYESNAIIDINLILKANNRNNAIRVMPAVGLKPRQYCNCYVWIGRQAFCR